MRKNMMILLAVVLFVSAVCTNTAVADDTYTYVNGELGFTLTMPASFQDKILIEESKSDYEEGLYYVEFTHKASRDALEAETGLPGGGWLFSIHVYRPPSVYVADVFPAAAPLATHNGVTYVLMRPTDVQFLESTYAEYSEISGALVEYYLGLKSGVFNVITGSFIDTAGHWAEEAIEFWSGTGMVAGYTDGTFRPNNPINRAETATIMARLMEYTAKEESTYTDVVPGEWYEDAVLKATAAGIMSGYGNGEFGPFDNLTRQDAVVIICRARGIAPSSQAAGFTDDGSIADYAKGYVAAMVQSGHIGGYSDNTFRPTENITRAEMVTILNNTVTAGGME
ncbi:MAG: S-layer homology domain-containing protein [Oscillospiraceae bacterium]|nr:S-layer homology domain-containing protein [Oscillospiraceae bacterium]